MIWFRLPVQQESFLVNAEFHDPCRRHFGLAAASWRTMDRRASLPECRNSFITLLDTHFKKTNYYQTCDRIDWSVHIHVVLPQSFLALLALALNCNSYTLSQWRNKGPRWPRSAGGRHLRGAPNRCLNMGQFWKLN